MEKVETLKKLLGITDSSKDEIVLFVITNVEETICNYCNIKEVPQGLSTTCINMALDMYRSQAYGQEENQGTARSVSVGDVSVSYENNNLNPENILKNYSKQLEIYRKLRW